MAKNNAFRLLTVVQIFFITTSILPLEANGLIWNTISNATGSVVRSVGRSTSSVMDKTQSATQTVASAVRKVKPLRPVTDTAASALSNVLGTASRLLGKSVREDNVTFLLSRKMKYKNYSKEQMDTVNRVIAYALTNVILHKDDMNVNKPLDPIATPILDSLVKELLLHNADKKIVENVRTILGRNGHCDLPTQIKDDFLNEMEDSNWNINYNTLIHEINWIAERPKGFYKLNSAEMNDYKLKTKKKLRNCVILHPLKFENNMNTNMKTK